MDAVNFAPLDWELYAACYDTLCALQPYRDLIDTVISNLDLQPDDHLLDVGCGTGNLLAQAVTGMSTQHAGVDFSPAMLTRAAKKCAPYRVTFQQADIAHLPWATSTFNKLSCVNVLYALADPADALREMARVLSPGGTLVLTTPKQGFDNGLILKAHAKSNEPDSFWQHGHTSPEREEKLIRAAISDESIITNMLYVAAHNRRIAQTATFHFLTETELVKLLRSCGFRVQTLQSTYAEQAWLVVASRECDR